VRHFRFKPVKHKLCYRVFSFLIDVDEFDQIARENKYFSRNRFNLFSFYDRDHSGKKGMTVVDFIRGQLEDAQIEANGKIKILFYPRMFGYAFNPITVYYCYDMQDNLIAILYNVRNTFGGRHGYLIKVRDEHQGNHFIEQSTDKLFHVSPFIDMDMRYNFKIKDPSDHLTVSVRVDEDGEMLLNTNYSGRGTPITDKKLKGLIWRYPLMTIKVVMAIHYEAVKLLLKGLRLRAGAPDPAYPITIIE